MRRRDERGGGREGVRGVRGWGRSPGGGGAEGGGWAGPRERSWVEGCWGEGLDAGAGGGTPATGLGWRGP